jgi:hypothetical protein
MIQRRIRNFELNLCISVFAFFIVPHFICWNRVITVLMACVHSISETFKVHCFSESELTRLERCTLWSTLKFHSKDGLHATAQAVTSAGSFIHNYGLEELWT